MPVHPLQFQRHIRSLGVDSDCKIVLYDKGQLVWSAYGFWLFKLFGHDKISLLNGGFVEYEAKAKEQSNLYRIVEGPENPTNRLGNYKARWVSVIATFDDIIANFETQTYDIIDAQSEEVSSFKFKNMITISHSINLLRNSKEKQKEPFLDTFVEL